MSHDVKLRHFASHNNIRWGSTCLQSLLQIHSSIPNIIAAPSSSDRKLVIMLNWQKIFAIVFIYLPPPTTHYMEVFISIPPQKNLLKYFFMIHLSRKIILNIIFVEYSYQATKDWLWVDCMLIQFCNNLSQCYFSILLPQHSISQSQHL